MMNNAAPPARPRQGHAGKGKNAAKIFALMSLTGPFFGALPYLAVMLYAVVYAALTEPVPGPAEELASASLGVVTMAVVFSYILGGLSAVICAALVAGTVYRTGKIGFLATVAVGIASSLIGGALWALLVRALNPGSAFAFGWSLVLPAAVAAAICWLIMRKLGWVQTIETATFTED